MWPARIWNAALKAAPLRLWAMILAGPTITLGTAALATIIADDAWPLDLRGKQLDFLGWALLICLALIAIIIVSLAAVRVKGTGFGGTSFEIDAAEGDRDDR